MRAPLLLLLAVLLAVPRGAGAQCGSPPMPCGPNPQPVPHSAGIAWEREARMLGINAALGGLTAGVLNKLRGGDFSDAFLRGALGGTVTYGAKRIAVQHFDGAGFLARQVGSVGDSFVRNAAEGVPLLDRIYLPLWFVRLEVQPNAEERAVQPRVDLLTAGWTVYSLFDDDLTFDLGRSVSSGALVYGSAKEISRDEDGRVAIGATIGSVILLTEFDHRTLAERNRTFAHERIHVLQLDQVHSYWSGPFEEWGLRSVGLDTPSRWVDLNLLPHFFVLYSGLSWDDRPWEIEAEWMAS